MKVRAGLLFPVIQMEIEARVKIDDLNEIKHKLIELGAEFYNEKSQVDTFYKKKGEEYAPAGPGNVLLRVRESNKNKLTLKILTEKTGVWIEHETDISSPEQTKIILDKAGFGKVTTMTKNRIPGKLDDFEICLDNYKRTRNIHGNRSRLRRSRNCKEQNS